MMARWRDTVGLMAPREGPAERILRLAAYAHRAGRPLTLTDIAEDVPGYRTPTGPAPPVGSQEWETLRKRVSRDISDLQEHWGIELAYDESDHTYSLRAPYFTDRERAALIAAAATVDVQGIDATAPGALGSAVGDDATQIVLLVHDLVKVLRAAIGTRTPVRFVHDGRARHVQPYAIGIWRTHWYLAGLDLDHRAVRRYRLDRIGRTGEAEPIVPSGDAGAYEIPADFDLEAAFDLDPNTWGSDPPLQARVRVHADHAEAFRRELGGTVVAHDGDHVVVALEVRHYASTRNRLLAFRTNALVLAPPELVDVVRSHLATLAEGP
jgi:predicted DNA-binding transcriptional regulator YafY